MSDIFISYASSDREHAKRLADLLSARGYSVWWDRTIPPGRVFDEVIQEAINSARCMVVLWSQDSVRSNWVKTEAAEGASRSMLVPALVQEVAPPIEFKRIQAANLTGWDGREDFAELSNLLASIERLLRAGASPATAARAAVTMTAPKSTSRVKIFGLGLAAGIVVDGALWLATKSRDDGDLPPPRQGKDTDQTQSTIPPAGGSSEHKNTQESTQIKPKHAGVNLLSEEAGGQLLAASTERWRLLVDGKEETYNWTDSGFAVFGFRDGRDALIHTFTVLIASQGEHNLKDFELLVGNTSPTGPFESIGRFTTQNMRMMQDPYQAFEFTPVKAKYFKVQALSSFSGKGGVNLAHEFQLFGTLQ